jgi:hypothetical protein
MGERYFQSERGNKRRPVRSSLQTVFYTRRVNMLTKITMTLVAAVIACTSPTIAGGVGNRETKYTYKIAQYCMPQLDELPVTTGLYC